MAAPHCADNCAIPRPGFLFFSPFASRLSENNIEVVDVTPLEAFPTLTHLFLSRNWITAIPDRLFAGMPQLTQLWLQENRITSISAGSFQNLDNLVLL